MATHPGVEIESGRRNDRPQLALALDACRKTKARLVVATMSRLTRDTRALLKLKDDKVEVTFCDLPEIPPGAIGRLIMTVLAAVNEFEARQTGERTKAALQAAKARGVKLGGPRRSRLAASKRGALTNKRLANEHASRVLPLVRDLQNDGLSMSGIARALTLRGVPSRRGGSWSAMQVSNVLKRSNATTGKEGVPPC
jgi:DNA invertase Pin-like site-specific DNA recombinase